jgi:transposase
VDRDTASATPVEACDVVPESTQVGGRAERWVCRKKIGESLSDQRLQIIRSGARSASFAAERPAILERCPELQAASDQVRAFAAMLTNLTGQDLPNWIAAARDAGLPGIASFAKGLEHDLDAVTNGLTMNWSSGPVEGRVNHIKMVKRQMFGRAGLPLLRKHVLLTAKGRAVTMTLPVA